MFSSTGSIWESTTDVTMLFVLHGAYFQDDIIVLKRFTIMQDLIIADYDCVFCRMRKSIKLISPHFVVWLLNEMATFSGLLSSCTQALAGSPGTPDKQRMNFSTSWIIPIPLHEIWNTTQSLSADVIRESNAFLEWRTSPKLTLQRLFSDRFASLNRKKTEKVRIVHRSECLRMIYRSVTHSRRDFSSTSRKISTFDCIRSHLVFRFVQAWMIESLMRWIRPDFHSLKWIECFQQGKSFLFLLLSSRSVRSVRLCSRSHHFVRFVVVEMVSSRLDEIWLNNSAHFTDPL